MEFYAGDFEYVRGERFKDRWFNYTGYSDVRVEYSPYGEDRWETLEWEEVDGMTRPVAYGALFRASLDNVSLPSATGWYNVRIKVYDNSDNYQMQEIAPAFKLEKLSGVETPAIKDPVGDDAVIYSIDGRRLMDADANGLYNQRQENHQKLNRTLALECLANVRHSKASNNIHIWYITYWHLCCSGPSFPASPRNLSTKFRIRSMPDRLPALPRARISTRWFLP